MNADALLRLKQRRQGAETPLSSVATFSVSSLKLSAVGKGVTAIDEHAPENYLATQRLYVSRNQLTSLNGVEQFKDLRAVSAADNSLATLQSVAALATLQHLQSVNLEDGNPLADIPNYRSHLICLLPPSLDMLDGRPVRAQDREAAQTVVALQKCMLQAAVSNACFVHGLGRALQLARVHRELLSAKGTGSERSKGKWPQQPEPCFPLHAAAARVASVWHFEKTLDETSLAAIKQAITSEVVRRWRKVKSNNGNNDPALWHEAYCQVLAAQLAALGELLGMLMADSRDSSTGQGSLQAGERAVAQLSCLHAGSPGAVEQAGELVSELQAAHSQLLQEMQPLPEEPWVISAGICSPERPSPSPMPRKDIERENEDATAFRSANQQLTSQLEEALVRIELLEKEVAASQASLGVFRQENMAQQAAVASLKTWLEAANSAAEAAASKAEAAEVERAHAHRLLIEERADRELQIFQLQDRLDAAASAQRAAEADAELQRQALLAAKEHCPEPILLQVHVTYEAELETERARCAELEQRASSAEARLDQVEKAYGLAAAM